MRRLKLLGSFGVLAIGVWCGAVLVPQRPLPAALTIGYLFWTLFWGFPPVWRWWRRQTQQLMTGCLIVGWPVALSLGAALVFTSSLLYSVCGGGLYQFCKYLSRTRRPTPSAVPPPP